MPDDDLLKLWCWYKDTPPSNNTLPRHYVFSVRVPRDEHVSALQQLVKAEIPSCPATREIPASELVLYKVPSPARRSLAHPDRDRDRRRLPEGAGDDASLGPPPPRKLKRHERIRDVFPLDPPERHVSIIICLDETSDCRLRYR